MTGNKIYIIYIMHGNAKYDTTAITATNNYHHRIYPVSGQTKQEDFLLKRFEKVYKEIGIKFQTNNYLDKIHQSYTVKNVTGLNIFCFCFGIFVRISDQ